MYLFSLLDYKKIQKVSVHRATKVSIFVKNLFSMYLFLIHKTGYVVQQYI